jgi:hypothetical protein
VRDAVRKDPRYQAGGATQRTIERRMADVKERWTSPDPLTDRYRFDRHVAREIEYVLGGL